MKKTLCPDAIEILKMAEESKVRYDELLVDLFGGDISKDLVQQLKSLKDDIELDMAHVQDTVDIFIGYKKLEKDIKESGIIEK